MWRPPAPVTGIFDLGSVTEVFVDFLVGCSEAAVTTREQCRVKL